MYKLSFALTTLAAFAALTIALPPTQRLLSKIRESMMLHEQHEAEKFKADLRSHNIHGYPQTTPRFLRWLLR